MAGEQLTDGTEANHLALIFLAERFANWLSRRFLRPGAYRTIKYRSPIPHDGITMISASVKRPGKNSMRDLVTAQVGGNGEAQGIFAGMVERQEISSGPMDPSKSACP